MLKAFASFGFCKAHAAAFALPTYQSAWLKAHHPAAFLAGVLTHDPGMYPKRLILDDARSLGIAVLGLDVNASDGTYRVERLAPWDEPPPAILDQLDAGPDRPDDGPRPRPHPDLPDGRDYGIRLSLADVKGITDAEVERIVAGRPYASLADFWHRARVSRPVVERLVVAGAFDSLYGLGGLAARLPVRRRGQVTRRDLMLQVVELDRWTRATTRGTGQGTAAGRRRGGARVPAARRARTTCAPSPRPSRRPRRAAVPAAEQPVQLALDLGDAPDTTRLTGLPEMTMTERVHAELEVLGLDASAHVVDAYAPDARRARRHPQPDLLDQRNRAELLVAGVKVATQTPPIRSGRRVVFLTLDDSTGPVDATFFEDVQGPYAATVFHSWLLVVRGVLRRTGPRGVSLRATGAWQLPPLWEAWTGGGLPAVHAALDAADVLAHAQAAPDDERREVLVEYTAEADPGRGGEPFHPAGRGAAPAGRDGGPGRRHGRRPAAPPGPGARQRFQAVAVRGRQAAGRGRQVRPAQAVALQPGQLRPVSAAAPH